jgi:hypothetical protein
MAYPLLFDVSLSWRLYFQHVMRHSLSRNVVDNLQRCQREPFENGPEGAHVVQAISVRSVDSPCHLGWYHAFPGMLSKFCASSSELKNSHHDWDTKDVETLAHHGLGYG